MLGNYGKISYGLRGPTRLAGNNSKSSTLFIPPEPKGQCLGNILEAKLLVIGCCFTPVSALFACMTFPAKLFCPGALLSYTTSLHGHEMDNQLRSDPNQHKNWCYKVLHPLSSHHFYCFLKLLWLKFEKEKEFLDSSRVCLGVRLCVCVETLLSVSINNTVFILFISWHVFSSNAESSDDLIRFRVNCHPRLNVAVKKKENPSATLASPYCGAAQHKWQLQCWL